MALMEYPAGTTLFQSEQPISALHIIMKGTVRAAYPGGEYYLSKGDVIGVCDLSFDTYFVSYIAEEATALAPCPCSGRQLSDLLRTKPDIANLIITSMFKQVQEISDQYELARFDCDNFYHYLTDSYDDYLAACTKHQFPARALPELESLSALVLEEDIAVWLGGYYTQLRSLVAGTPIKEQDADFLLGLLFRASQDVYETISVCRVMFDYKSDITRLLMNENHLDFFDLYTGLLYKIGPNTSDSTSLIAALSTMMIQLEGQPSVDQDMYKKRAAEYRAKLHSLRENPEPSSNEEETINETPEVTDSLNTILAYSGVDNETATNFKSVVAQYSKLADKNSSDDASRKLRLMITKLFYQIYEKAFFRSLKDSSIPKVVKMFFNFGYVDEQLAGLENAAYLYSIVDKLPTAPDKGVYTIYEWLRAIYTGKKTPSRNEFDTDYLAHLHELRMTGKITVEEEKRLQDNREKQVLFEMQNMFPPVNKISFGRIISFCPLFSEHNILKDLPTTLVTAQKVEDTFKQIRSIDFSAYYRDTVYANPALGIGKENISVEVLPDVILMPNVGTRGVMWQEIEGKKRTTPARMMVSIFQMEDLTSVLVRLTGEFRWEMCKRIQGARWNDISEASLTSEYFDYIQFYRKNRDLSADAKDKIKLAMQKAKNSFKEMFIRDYISWILFEGTGSPRLNKVARAILFNYCPFSKEIRTKLKANPLYKETMDRYDIKLAQKIHHFDNLFQKLNNTGVTIPAELTKQRQYLDK